MAENTPPKRRASFWTLFWKPTSEIETSAEKYRTINIFKSDRAKLVYFLLTMLAISFALAIFAGSRAPVDVEGVLWSTAIFAFLFIFILFGHIWAMGIAVAIYVIDKALLMMPPTSAHPVPQIIFGLLCWHLGSTAIRVEIARRRRAKALTQSATPA
jgi:hypothetical protein